MSSISIFSNGFFVEKKPTWLSDYSMKLAQSFSYEKYSALGEYSEPGCHRIFGAYSKITEFRPIIKELISSDIPFQWFSRQPYLNFCLFREPLHRQGSQSYHRDSKLGFCSTKNNELLALIFLDDTNSMNGGTSFIPKSHILNIKNIHGRQITPNTKAGDVIWFTPNILHAGRNNRTGLPRRSILISLCIKELQNRRNDGDHNNSLLLTLSKDDASYVFL